jgi:hypothetical protein
MTARRFAICAVSTGLILVATFLALPPRSSGVTQAQFELLRAGMTQPEVENILCGPPRDVTKYGATVWIPYADGEPRSAFISPGSPDVGFFVSEHFRDRPPNEVPPKKATQFSYFPGTTAEQGRQAVWASETGIIAVYFGRDGTLQQKYFSTVDVTRPPTVMDWVESRPRMLRQSLGR